MEEQPKTSKRHVVLRSNATDSGVAAELIVLIQSFTSDGRISDSEAVELRDWLELNHESTLPSIEFLRTTLNQILADGRVTPEERKALHLAVERVLPIELRAGVRARRQAAELVEKAQQKEERTAERHRAALERERNRSLESANFMVAGVSHEGRAAIVDRYLNVGDVIFLVREPSNQFDSNAIEVRLSNGHQIGYVPREYAVGLAPILDSGSKHIASCTKILDGRVAPIPVVQAEFYSRDATVRGAVKASDTPGRQGTGSIGSSGCTCGSIVAIALCVALIVLLASC